MPQLRDFQRFKFITTHTKKYIFLYGSNLKNYIFEEGVLTISYNASSNNFHALSNCIYNVNNHVLNNISSLTSSIRQLEQVKESIIAISKYDTLKNADTAFQLEMTNKQQIELKKQLINQIHITKEGVPRAITYEDSKKLWKTKMPDGKRVYGKTIEIIYDKLMNYYGLSITDFSLKTIFDEALKHKDRTESVNPETLYHLQKTYERFIDDSLANTDIRKITCDTLSEYTLNMLRNAQKVDSHGVTHKVKRKAYLDYKSVLNLIFDYALAKDIIAINPLAKFKNKAFLKECDCTKAVSEEKIFSEEEIEQIKQEVRSRMEHKKYNGYFINGYAILFSILTGCRAGEIPAIKHSDIHWSENYLHIHAQQLSTKRTGGKEYYYADWTKDEKGVSNGGRKFPLTKEIRELLNELIMLQERKGIHSDYIFCHENGEWIKSDAYITCLRRLLTSMGFSVTNNHAFRMSLNSNILAAKLNLPVAKRAELLGHSPTTNMLNYLYASKQDMDDLAELFDSCNKPLDKITKFQVVAPRSPLKAVN